MTTLDLAISNFNEHFYRLIYPDVDAAIRAGSQGSALIHYINHGYSEGRVASINFDEQYYLANNPDVDLAIKAGRLTSAIQHYEFWGFHEGRSAKFNAFDGNSYLWGTSKSDIINGSNGNNFLNGSFGQDTIIGGRGNDTIDGGGDNDIAIYYGGSNEYHVVFYNNFVHVSDTIVNRDDTDTLYNVENIRFQDAILSLDAIRNNGARFSGLGGNDIVTGGNGNDFYVRGNAGDDTLYGLLGNDSLLGGDGNDYLDGGIGNDTMVGDLGNDVYIIDSAGDIVIESSTLSSEVDTVISSVSYVLGANLENLTLVGTAYANGTGNSLDNIIVGNTAWNILNGEAGNDLLNGEAGNDTMIGGLGNDTYIVDWLGDVVIETSVLSTEIDTVKSYVSYTLGANVENLVLLAPEALDGIGNALGNVITGSTAGNFINGLAGNDTMIGGLGNDIYIVDGAGDIVTETSTLITEIDVVLSSVSYTLGANLENLTLTGVAAVNGVGNALNNVIIGNAAENVLDGRNGNDLLTGGAGVDTYVLNKASVNTITDFAANEKLQISASSFGGLSTGNLAANQLLVGAGVTAATASTHKFIFNTMDKSLYFDSDGLNGAAAVKVAFLPGLQTISSSNFSVVA